MIMHVLCCMAIKYTLIKTGSKKSIEATLRKRRILFGIVCGAHGGYETAEVCEFEGLVGGAGCVGSQEKE